MQGIEHQRVINVDTTSPSVGYSRFGFSAAAISHSPADYEYLYCRLAARVRHVPVAAPQPSYMASRVGIVSDPIDPQSTVK